MSFGTIYRIVCTTNGKAYVGQTTIGTAQRFGEHMNATAKRGYAFGAAIRKHGRAAFRFVELEQCATRYDLDAAEKFWIDGDGTIPPRG